jgi:hypothetical protein
MVHGFDAAVVPEQAGLFYLVSSPLPEKREITFYSMSEVFPIYQVSCGAAI